MTSGRVAIHRRRDRAIVADVELGAREGHDLVAGTTLGHDRCAKLPCRSDHHNPHQAALDPRSAANAFIRSSSNTPSQRATTAVAMQLPMTLTAVRPMSMI